MIIVEEFWQYGTDESKTQLIKQDGVAHQCPVKGGEKLRAYIPDEVPQGWFLSHSIGNYGWIFNLPPPSTGSKNNNGYVSPRK